MAAGLGFKDFVTGEVLTAADVDGYLMQGVWVFASAAARDSAVTSPQEGNFAYLKDTNVTTYYTGSAWANLDTTGMTNPMTTTGDTIYSSSGSTPARLGIGTTGQVLTVAGGVPSWATAAGGGGMTVIASGAFTATATLDLTSISGSYKNLQFVARNINPNGDRTLRARFNGLTTSIYNAITITNINGSAATAAYTADDKFVLTAATAQSPLGGPLIIDIYDYANTTSFKTITAQLNHLNNGGQVSQMWLSGTIRTNDALNQITLSLSAGDFVAGGTYTLYGVN
jgi:hypothetical protein